MNIVISPLAAGDYESWLPLWNENNQNLCAAEVTSTTWSRLLDPASSVNGFAAREGGAFAGFVHYILHPVTGHIEPACYMQDLFVVESFRRRGIGEALVRRLAAEGAKQNWARFYWLAEDKNAAAQALYANLGIKLDFSFFMLPLKQP
jgi:ribosomal protein S18 acetylase RimI-like enzyme